MLGSAEVDVYKYWSGGKNSHELKCNETILYSEIDLSQSYAQFCKTNEALQVYYNKMDEMYLCLKAVEFCGDNDDLLRCAGAIIGNWKSDGSLSMRFESIEDENRYLDGLVAELRDSLSPEQETEVDVTNPEFDKWFEENVVQYNYYNTPLGKSRTMPVGMNGLGATTGNDSYSEQMKGSAMSLLYYVADKDKLYDGCRDEDEMLMKTYSSVKSVNWFANQDTNMTQKSIENCIKSGIAEQTEGKSPDDVVEGLKHDDENGVNGLGYVPVELIVTLVVTAIVIACKLISNLVKSKYAAKAQQVMAEEYQPDPYGYAPEEDDFIRNAKAQINQMLEEGSEMSIGEILAVVAIAGVGIFGSAMILKKNAKGSN